MPATAITAKGLGKAYRISHDGEAARYRTLRESLISAARRSMRRDEEPREEIWALRDASFDIEQGEAVGVIGRNGAGKSTMLKLLSRITRPSEGSADVFGRIGSLLEVGTGMHPELTGRENVFLNGAILGMARGQIAAKFDEIVDFSEIDRFLDTPVKRYSTGMHTRLAFSVAAHLDTDILVVDEVLAVGDRKFQDKCLGKMQSVASEGRTVIFVSHNMAAVTRFCPRAILLDAGKIAADGPVSSVIKDYLADASTDARVDLHADGAVDDPAAARLQWAEVRDDQGAARTEFSIGDTVTIAFGVALGSRLPRVKFALSLRASDGTPLAHVVDDDSDFVPSRAATREVQVSFADIRLYPGTYYVSVWIADGANTIVKDQAQDVLHFDIIDGGRLTARRLPREHGFLFLTPTWLEKELASPYDSQGVR